MNPGAIYSKSGKGVQEASGKTSLLKRGDRAVLSAIDGRATLNEVAQKVGKPFDASFQALIAQLDKDGFVREVIPGGAAAAAPARAAPKAAGASKPAPAPAAAGEDLDFTGIIPVSTKSAAKPAPDPAAALFKARQEAEARASEERERLRAEAQAKARAEAEAKAQAEAAQKLREEAAAKVRAEAEAKAKAARDEAMRIAAEAKAKAEAEARAKIEAERQAREEAERKAREEAEKARREAEELRQRLEEERRAREEAERKAREEAARKAQEEAERKAREEAERKAREEAEKARREAEELRQRLEEERKAREEAERKAREEIERKAREEADRKARAEQEAQMRRAREEAERKRAEQARKREEAKAQKAADTAADPLPEIALPSVPTPAATPAAGPAKAGGEGLDALMADLDFFTQREDEERKARDEADNREKEERKRKLHEEGEQRAREQADKERRDAEERQREERERREQERREAEEAEQRSRAEAQRQREDAEERARRAREAMAVKQAQPADDDIGVTDDDLDMDEVRRDEAAVPKDSRKARREREREQRRLEKEARERAKVADKAAARAAKKKPDAAPEAKVTVRRPRKWGKPLALTLLLLLVAGIALLHVMPVPVQDYQQAASEALRQPVRIGSARLSLYGGLQLKLTDVRIGEGTRIAAMRAFPEIGSLASPVKAFERIELDGVTLRQEALDESLFASARGPNFRVGRIFIKDLRLEGPVAVPALEADVRMADDGSVRTVLLRGPEGLMGQLMPKAGAVEFDVTAGSFTVPFARELSLSSFAMKGRATRQGMRIEAWGGSALGGALSGTASLRWGGGWQLDGVLTARGINAAVFAPALLSEGHAEGTGKFAMSGSDPATLVRSGRVEGNFTIGKGVLGSFDLARAIRTDGREVNGRTPFVELNGLGVYDRGAVALRNVVIGAGALQAGASADISQSGALSGRIVADVRTASQSLRATLLLGGTVKDPQVRN